MDADENSKDGSMSRRAALGLAAGATLAAAVQAAPRPPRVPLPLNDIVAWDATALGAAIHTRKVSCVEVMSAYLNHIAAVNPQVNAIVALQDREPLLVQARERDDQLAHGQSMGPLHGFPHAVKDLQAVKGIRTTQGSPILRDFVPAADALMVERLRGAGAIFIGKTNAPEFGLGSHTYNPVYGITRNAYDLSKSAGARAAALPCHWHCAWCRWRMARITAAVCAIRPVGIMSSGFGPASAASPTMRAIPGCRP